MKILCIFSRYPLGENDSNITKDLARGLSQRGHELYVASLLEKKFNKPSFLQKDGEITVLNIKTGNMFDSVSRLEKFITTLVLPFTFYRAVKKFYSGSGFDLIIAHTPFMANHRLIKNLKRLYGAKALLILWDIFPQNAVDIGLMKKGLLYRWLRHNEKKMFEQFELISCMSEGNKAYLLKYYSYLDPKSLFVCYNWACSPLVEQADKIATRSQYGFSMNDKICLFGGNIGKPQKIENIIKLANLTSNHPEIKYLFVGKGTEFDHLKRLVAQSGVTSVKIIDYLERSAYENLASVCDLGLVSLDERFTVPNFPSKTVDYFRSGLPVFAVLDSVSAADYGNFISKVARAGKFILADRVDEDFNQLVKLANDTSVLKQLSENAKKFFIEQLDVKFAAEKMEKNLQNILN